MEISSVGSLEQNSRADVCLHVCLSVYPSVQAFWSPEHERLVRSGRANIRSMRRSGRKDDGACCRLIGCRWQVPRAIVPVADRSVTRGRCHVLSCKKLQKSIGTRCRPNQWRDSGQTWWTDSHRSHHIPWGDVILWGFDGGAPFTRLRGT